MPSLADLLANSLFAHASTADLFNPYSTRHPELDLPDAVAIRRANLLAYCSHARPGAQVLLLAEAPGPWGCRFSGVPITSEAQLLDPAFPLTGRQSSRRDQPHTEYSSGIYWRVLEPWIESVFTWNTVPFHPHKPGNPLSIRTPRAGEITRFLPVVDAVVEHLRPRLVVAVGRKAESALQRLGIACQYVRHPSQGGAPEFENGILDALSGLGVKPVEPGRRGKKYK